MVGKPANPFVTRTPNLGCSVRGLVGKFGKILVEKKKRKQYQLDDLIKK